MARGKKEGHLDLGKILQDKRAIVAQLIAAVAAQTEITRAAAAAARENATHEESRAEDDKDTRAIEAGYLAGAHAARARELAATQKALELFELRAFGPDDAIELAALVDVEREDGKTTTYFLAPHGGGSKVAVGKKTIWVVTPESPLGAALLEKRVGEELELKGGSGEIVAVR